MPSAMVTTQDQAGPVFFAPSKQIMFSGLPVDHRDVVQFISPIQGLLFTSPNAVLTSLKLEASRMRSASNSLPNGVLRQIGGEPLSAQELADLATAFNSARVNNQTAALNEFLQYDETKALPDNMLMIESADFSGKEMCRLGNIPFYLAGFDIGSYQYTTSAGAREDLYLFGARQYLDCVSQTLSGNNVLPRGTYVKFDIDSYLESMMKDEMMTETPDMTETIEETNS